MKLSLVLTRIGECKRAIDAAVSEVLHSKMTHTQALERIRRYRSGVWYAAMPAWADRELWGYETALSSTSYHSPIFKALVNAHVYQSRLYASFDMWRANYPDLPGSELQNSCVVVWRGTGKIFFAGLSPEQKVLEGQILYYRDTESLVS